MKSIKQSGNFAVDNLVVVPAAKIGRNPAIELYRVVLMFMIVFHHAGCLGYIKGRDADYPLLFFFFSTLVWHVDGFISITGWFGTRFSFSRFAKVWGTIAFYSIFSILFGFFAYGNHVCRYVAGGWFGRTYLYFLFLTPVLNAAIDNLAKCDKKRMFLVWALLATAVVLTGLPYPLLCLTNVWPNQLWDYSIMTFILVYVNVRLLKVSGLYERITKRHVLVACVFFLAGVVLSKFNIMRSGYGSSQVMLMAVAGLVFFSKYVRVPGRIARVVMALSPLTFGIYILHETTVFGRLIYRIPQEKISDALGGGHPLLIIFVTAVFCFALCACIDALRRVIVSPLAKLILPHLAKIDKRVGLI